MKHKIAFRLFVAILVIGLCIVSFVLSEHGFKSLGTLFCSGATLALLCAIYKESHTFIQTIADQDDERGREIFNLKSCIFDGTKCPMVCYEKGFVMVKDKYEVSDFIEFRAIMTLTREKNQLLMTYVGDTLPEEHLLTINDVSEENAFIAKCKQELIEVT